MSDYRNNLQTLYKVPLGDFVAARKRLADELRGAGDRDGAERLARRRRPTASAWAVNQLYWHARDAFDALLAAAAQLRKGDLSRTNAYREGLGLLRQRAAAILQDAGHPASGATLQRVMGTLAAVAAAGGFDPDPPGALPADRDPPGFEAVGAAPSRGAEARRGAETPSAVRSRPVVSERERRAVARADERATKQAEARAKKEAEARAREIHRLRSALQHANAKVQAREQAWSLLQKQERAAAKDVEEAREVVHDLERKLKAVDVGE